MAHAMVKVRHKGDFKNTEKFFAKDISETTRKVLESLGQRGVDALAAATPVRTGKTAASWRYSVVVSGGKISLRWDNDNKTSKGDNIVILLIRGHGTAGGHYVKGNDFVTPAIKPIFDEIAQEAWMEVTK